MLDHFILQTTWTAAFRNLHDFLLVMQIEFQRELCMDTTYKTNDYDYYTDGFLMIIKKLSNREDKSVLLYILEALKERCSLVHIQTGRHGPTMLGLRY